MASSDSNLKTTGAVNVQINKSSLGKIYFYCKTNLFKTVGPALHAQYARSLTVQLRTAGERYWELE
jgi:hypothetical protein